MGDLRLPSLRDRRAVSHTESAIGNSVGVRSPSAAGRLVARVQSRRSRTLVAAVAPAGWFAWAGGGRGVGSAGRGQAQHIGPLLCSEPWRRPGGVLRESARLGSSGQGDAQVVTPKGRNGATSAGLGGPRMSWPSPSGRISRTPGRVRGPAAGWSARPRCAGRLPPMHHLRVIE